MLVILGLSAVVAPWVERLLIRLDVPVLIASAALCYLLALDGEIGTIDGVVMFCGIIAYTSVLIRLRPPATRPEPGRGSMCLHRSARSGLGSRPSRSGTGRCRLRS